MASDFLATKMKAMHEVMEAQSSLLAAVAKFKKAIGELPGEWSNQVLKSLSEDGLTIAGLVYHPYDISGIDHAGLNAYYPASNSAIPTAEIKEDDEDRPLPSPSAAIQRMLEKYPKGVNLDDITKALAGKIKTTSKDFSHAIKSTIKSMKKIGLVIEDPIDFYRLNSDFGQKTGSIPNST